jgi:hypothetical protein
MRNMCIPIKLFKNKENNKKTTWLTNGIKKSCKNKRLLKTLASQTKDKIIRNHYKLYAKILKKCIKQSKKITILTKYQNHKTKQNACGI